VNRIEIRSAVKDDAESIAQLVNRAYRPAPGAESGWTHEGALVDGERIDANSVKSALRSAVVLVGVNDSRIVGCVQIELHGRAAHIGMLAVDPFLQASGVGKFLLAAAEQFASSDLEAEEAVLVVIAARKELIEFYLRRGYRKSGEKLQYPIGSGVGEPSEKAMNLAVLKKSFNKAMHATSA
jgi:ribosomal protein S18 acetylase RimI-like enzyme